MRAMRGRAGTVMRRRCRAMGPAQDACREDKSSVHGSLQQRCHLEFQQAF